VDAGRPTPSLGQLVLQRGLLNEAQLEVALAEHLSTGKRLREVLVERGWLTPEQIGDLFRERAENGDRGIDQLKTSMADAEAELEALAEEAGPGIEGHPGHVLFVWSHSGYELLSRAGEPPLVGSEVGVSGGLRVVTKVGPSPLPGDRRPCAFLDAPS
jgi:hypothetical protein